MRLRWRLDQACRALIASSIPNETSSMTAATVVARHTITRIVDKGPGRGATVTYDKVVHLVERNIPDVKTRHVASVVYGYQPKVLAKERDRLENPFGFVVTAYRSDPEINTQPAGGRP